MAVFTSSESLAHFHIVLCGAYLCFHPRQVFNLGLYLILMKRSSAPLPHMVLVESLGLGTSLAVQWLGIHSSTARGTGSIPGRGSDPTCHALQPKKKKKSLGLEMIQLKYEGF